MKTYLFATLVTTLLLCVAVAAVNYRVDPYTLYGFDTADSKRLSRIDQFYHMRLTKPKHLLQLRPEAVIVGTSRTAAMRPQHASWAGDRGYNFSSPGLTVYEMLRFIQHAHAGGSLKKLMVGLDFEAFVTAEPRVRPGFAESRFARSPEDFASIAYRRQSVTDMADTMLSLSALSRSAAALTGTGNAPRRKYYKDGAWSATSRLLMGKPGYVFVASNRLIAHSNRRFHAGDNFTLLADILRFCHQQNIETRLFITPIHVFMLDWWYTLGYAQDWRQFHQRLVTVNASAARQAGKQPFRLMGFNMADGIVDEPVYPPKGSNNAWFQDGIHFGEELSAKITRAVWVNSGSIGQNLRAENVDSYLARVDQLTAGFRSSHAATVTELRHLICQKTKQLAGAICEDSSSR